MLTQAQARRPPRRTRRRSARRARRIAGCSGGTFAKGGARDAAPVAAPVAVEDGEESGEEGAYDEKSGEDEVILLYRGGWARLRPGPSAVAGAGALLVSGGVPGVGTPGSYASAARYSVAPLPALYRLACAGGGGVAGCRGRPLAVTSHRRALQCSTSLLPSTCWRPVTWLEGCSIWVSVLR